MKLKNENSNKNITQKHTKQPNNKTAPFGIHKL